jgi:phosphohistidine phosphatase
MIVRRPSASPDRIMPPHLRRVLLLRHAKSAWDEPGQPDFDRPLAPRGRRAAALMGVYLRDEGLVPDLVLCSAARRARETWTICEQKLGASPHLEVEDDLYLASPDHLLKRLRAVPDRVCTVLFVGHEGGVDELTRQGTATLERYVAPKDLV